MRPVSDQLSLSKYIFKQSAYFYITIDKNLYIQRKTLLQLPTLFYLFKFLKTQAQIQSLQSFLRTLSVKVQGVSKVQGQLFSANCYCYTAIWVTTLKFRTTRSFLTIGRNIGQCETQSISVMMNSMRTVHNSIQITQMEIIIRQNSPKLKIWV